MATKKVKAAPEVEPTIVAYKAFDQNLACRGFQYEVGKTFEMSGTPDICNRGFHACENPFDVFNYYPLGSRVARVTLTGAVDRHSGDDQDSKICGVKLTVDAELRMPEVVKAAVAWIVKAAKKNVATGYSGHAAATGYRGHAAATGYSGHAAATGYSGHAAATGDRGHAAATGDSSVAASLGMNGTALAAEGGAICLTYQEYDYKLSKYVIRHICASKVGENGIEPNKSYRLDASGNFVEAA